MRALLTLFGVIGASLIVCACDGLIVVISTAPTAVVGAHVDGGIVPLGTPVSGVLGVRGGDVAYHVVPPRAGTLVLGVSWNPSHGVIDVLFASNLLPRPIASPFTGRFPVQAGQSYMVRIADGSPSSPGEPSLPYTLTVGLE